MDGDSLEEAWKNNLPRHRARESFLVSACETVRSSSFRSRGDVSLQRIIRRQYPPVMADDVKGDHRGQDSSSILFK